MVQKNHTYYPASAPCWRDESIALARLAGRMCGRVMTGFTLSSSPTTYSTDVYIYAQHPAGAVMAAVSLAR